MDMHVFFCSPFDISVSVSVSVSFTFAFAATTASLSRNGVIQRICTVDAGRCGCGSSRWGLTAPDPVLVSGSLEEHLVDGERCRRARS